MITIREMHNDEHDVHGKAFVVWRGWHDSYSGLISRDFLDRLTLEKCIEISAGRTDGTLVALNEEGSVIGFASCGACRDEDLTDTGEVYAIYVLKEYHGMHAGSALMRECLKRLSGYPAAVVWTLAENRKAIAFYEHMGFRKDGTEKTRVIGTPVKEIRLALNLSGHRD